MLNYIVLFYIIHDYIILDVMLLSYILVYILMSYYKCKCNIMLCVIISYSVLLSDVGPNRFGSFFTLTDV